MNTENKKIRNATPKTYNGIKFRSTSEVLIYKTLLQKGIVPEYETKKILIWEGFTPTVPFYTKNTFSRKNRNIIPIKRTVVEDRRGIAGWEYTPDFYIEYKNKKIYIEVKGFCNDVWSYKCKLFRGYLETLPDKENYEFWEINTKAQLLECLEHLENE